MSKELKLNFCIILNPFSSGGRNIIFISNSDNNFLNKEVSKTNKYKEVKDFLENFGYTETDLLQFETSNNTLKEDLTTIDIRIFLEEFGLNYSRELEVNVVKELSNIEFYRDFNDVYEKENPSKFKPKKKIKKLKFTYKEPEYKEKVSLYFYLFLEFIVNQNGKPIIQFGGDFEDFNDYDDRNYIKIVKSEFERVSDPDKPNSIILSSCKTQKDFLKESGILYSGHFIYQRREEKKGSMIIHENKQVYKLAELKSFLSPNQSVVVETNRAGYDKLIELSKKIKKESIVELNKKIPLEYIKNKATDLKKHLDLKAEKLSRIDDFESAATIKRNIDFIDERFNVIKDLDKPYLTTEEYFKLFYIP
jgi:hypothetical protein